MWLGERTMNIGTSGPPIIFDKHRTGIASVGFVGFPSVGKVGEMSLQNYSVLIFLLVDFDVETHRHSFRSIGD